MILISIAKGFPLLLGGLAAILQQERKSPGELIAEVARALKKSKVEEATGKKPLSFAEEGVDVNQMSAISLMFYTLSTERLKLSAVVISLFHGPFSAPTAAKVLGIDLSEAIVQLEGLVASQIISAVNEEAKERKYDIHPLLQNMLTVSKIMITLVLLTWRQNATSMNCSCPEWRKLQNSWSQIMSGHSICLRQTE